MNFRNLSIESRSFRYKTAIPLLHRYFFGKVRNDFGHNKPTKTYKKIKTEQINMAAFERRPPSSSSTSPVTNCATAVKSSRGRLFGHIRNRRMDKVQSHGRLRRWPKGFVECASINSALSIEFRVRSLIIRDDAP